jgi:phosphoglycerate dehydrogenase-like enzyme
MNTRKKIVITQDMDLYPDQIERLKSLGEVTFYDEVPATPEEWLSRCQGADVICSGECGLKEKATGLKDVFISLPLVGVGWLDLPKLKSINVLVSNSPGCNKEAVAEWVVAMLLNLFRQLPGYINVNNLPRNSFPEKTLGLSGKKVCILGAGNVGKRVGELCGAFGMNVSYFKRGDDLLSCVKDVDVVANCLRYEPSTEGLLEKNFFSIFKKGSYFISIAALKTFDVAALKDSLGKNIAGAAIDAGDIGVGDTSNPAYRELLKSDRSFTTPHIAFWTDVTARTSNDIMIDNVEAYLKGSPINLVN